MLRTALYDLHKRLGARMVDFAGWEMPVMYRSIIEEHHATRSGCTLFDVSHMGRLYVTGTGATAVLERLCTRRMSDMTAGQARYSHMCREDGGILDDMIVSRIDEDHWLVVCNASNREKIVRWLQQHLTDCPASLEDRTVSTAMLAVQGPATRELADEFLPIDVTHIKRYRFQSGKYMGMDYVCSRTGYTGEDGYEIIVSAAAGQLLANSIFEADGPMKGRITPAGLGARDTLRLEAAMPLYGHELDEQVDPISAGQAWCVDLDRDFIGSGALRRIQEHGPRQQLIGFEVEGPRIARQDTPLQKSGRTIGRATSGTMSPTLQRVIGMGYVEPSYAEPGTQFEVNIRGRSAQAKVVPLPFYKRLRK